MSHHFLRYALSILCILLLTNCAARQVKRDGVLMSVEAAANVDLASLKQSYANKEGSAAYVDALTQFVSEFDAAPPAAEARYLLAKALYKKNRLSESYETLKSVNLKHLPRELHPKFYYFLVMNAKKNEDQVGVVKWNARLQSLVETQEMRDKINEEVKFFISTKLSQSDVEALLEKFGETYPSGYLHLRMGRYLNDGGKAEEAVHYFRRALDRIDDVKQRTQIREFLSQAGKTALFQKNVIGCILPLTGRYATYGERSLHGIQQALHFFNGDESQQLELAIYDSQGDPETAAHGVDYLIDEYGAIGIIGPLLSSTSERAAEKAQIRQIPMINLSQHDAITEKGDTVFRIAMTKRHQVNTLVKFSCEEKGLKRFAILYPEDNYGIEFSNLFWEKVEECGGAIVGVESYHPDQRSFNVELKKLVGLHQAKARKDEYAIYEERAKIELDQDDVKESQVKLPPQIDFDVLFIPDYAKTIGQVAPTLAYYDIENILLLGTQGWHSPKLLERGEEHVEGAVFVDGFFNWRENDKIRTFVSEYRHAYRRNPEIWAAQGYDAARLMVSVLESETIENRTDLNEKLGSVSTFTGVSGEISFLDNHDIDKRLFLITVHKGTFRKYDPELSIN